MNLSMQAKNSNGVDGLNELVAAFNAARGGRAGARDSLFVALSAVQLAQRIAGPAVPETLRTAAVDAVSSLSKMALHSVSFPIFETLLSQTYAAILANNGFTAADDKYRALLEALVTFLILAQDNPAYATEPVLRQIISDMQPSKPEPKPYPEINYRANILQIFTPGSLTAVDLEPLQVVVYRGELLGGGFGPELWGLALIKGEEAHVLLETGEYITVPAISLTLAITKDYATSELPPYLLACAKLFMPILFGFLWGHDIPPELLKAAARLDKNLGAFTRQISALSAVPSTEIEGCEAVLDAARWKVGAAKSVGAVRTFSLAQSGAQIVITAQQAAVRPYITATLVQSDTGAILMRLDTPREFSARGVYLFPLADTSAVLIVI